MLPGRKQRRNTLFFHQEHDELCRFAVARVAADDVQQVVAILGRPDAVRSNGPYEQFEYTHRPITGWSWDRSDFTVILKDGRVVEYGHGEVRNRSPQVVYTRPNAPSQPQPIIYPYQPQPQTQNINVRVQTPPSAPSWSNPYGN